MDRSTTNAFLAWIRTLLLHGCCWAAFIAYEQWTLIFGAGLSTMESATFYYYYAINILLFYAHYQLLNKVVSLSRVNYTGVLTSVLAELLLFMLFKAALTWKAGFTPNAFSINFFQVLQLDLFRSVYFAGLSTLVWVGQHLETFRHTAVKARLRQLEAEREAAETARKLSEAENAYLQQQLNPHLLFNTLNFVHSAVYPHAEDAADCLLILSDIMRYSFESAGPDSKVDLGDEIKQIENLVAINRYRFGEHMAVTFRINGYVNGQRIPPLLLLTLTENVFKHGVVNDPQKPAVIDLKITGDNMLIFHTLNRKKAATAYQRTQQVGLRNLRTRLDFTYGDKAVLNLKNTDQLYEITLHVNL